MKKKIITVLIIGIFLILVFFFLKLNTSNNKPNSNSNLKQVKIGMGYIPNVQFAPFYVAKEKGYYQEVGLEPNFDYAMSPDLLKLLGQGNLDFVITTGDDVILGVEKEIPVKYVMTLYSQFPIGIVSLSEKNITKSEDLKGKTVGLPVFYGSSYIGLKTYMNNQGLNENEVKLEAIGYTQVQSLTEGKVDAVVVFSMNEPVQLEALGYSINVIEFSDFIDLASAGIVTSNENLTNDQEMVANFIQATWKAMQDIDTDPKKGFDIAASYAQIPDDQRNTQYNVLLRSIDFWKDKKGNLTNKISFTTWDQTINTLYNLQLIETTPKFDIFINDQFID